MKWMRTDRVSDDWAGGLRWYHVGGWVAFFITAGWLVYLANQKKDDSIRTKENGPLEKERLEDEELKRELARLRQLKKEGRT